MERIDLKAAMKSTLLTLTLALALEFAQNTTKGEGGFLSTVEIGGRKWTNDEMSPSSGRKKTETGCGLKPE
jgi:hypothetical protein